MTIGSAVVLFVIGAILTYGLQVDVQGVDLDMIGYILMAAGIVAGVIGLIMWAVNRSAAGQTVHEHREIHIPESDPHYHDTRF